MEQKPLADKLFYLTIVGFLAGIFFRSFFDIGVSFSLLFALVGTALAICSYIWNQRSVLLIGCVLLALGFGMLRYDVADRDSIRAKLATSIGTMVDLEGIIVDEPDIRESNTRLLLRATSDKVNVDILLTIPHEPRYAYGDRVTVSGKIERPRSFIDEKTFREVDYVAHLSKDGIFYEMFRPKITLISRGAGNPIVSALFSFKAAFIRNVSKLVPEPHASLLGGLVVGAKQSLGKKLLDDFRTVGVIHIVVLSGYNITIIAFFIERLLSRLGKRVRLTCAATAMILFAIMVGASATVIRATVMALLVLLARGTGRVYQVTRALLLAGVVMLLHNPKILVFDTSFQLSFLATVGLIYLSPFIEPRVRWVTSRWHLREIIIATLATQIFVLPFLLYKTGVLSIVALPVNLLILPTIPATMLFGFFGGMFAFVSSALAIPFMTIAHTFLAYELWVVEEFSRFSFASMSLPYFPFWLVMCWYGVYATLFFLWHRKQSTVTF